MRFVIGVFGKLLHPSLRECLSFFRNSSLFLHYFRTKTNTISDIDNATAVCMQKADILSSQSENIDLHTSANSLLEAPYIDAQNTIISKVYAPPSLPNILMFLHSFELNMYFYYKCAIFMWMKMMQKGKIACLPPS